MNKKQIGIATLTGIAAVTSLMVYKAKKSQGDSDTPKTRAVRGSCMMFHTWGNGKYCKKCGARHPFR